METILVAIISGGLALLGTVITVIAGNRRTESNLRTNQAVMEARLEALTGEVRKHNNFAQRMPVVEEQIKALREQNKEQIKTINHRLKDLEKNEKE